VGAWHSWGLKPEKLPHKTGPGYDVISILLDGGHSVTNLLPVSGLSTSDVYDVLPGKEVPFVGNDR